MYGISKDRLYYGTDTHCDGLFVGCALALILFHKIELNKFTVRAGKAIIGIAAVYFLVIQIPRSLVGAAWRDDCLLIFFASAISYRYFETPFLRLKDRLFVRPKQLAIEHT
jgi:peptidoglycan/LPS O-acetylase OafA/YrhL